MYPTVFYFVIFIIIPCNRPFYYRSPLCARYPCLSRYSWLALWDSICHFMLPAFIIGIFGIGLFVRVIYTRYRVRRRIDWRKYRKLTIQLLPISVLYIALKCPPMIMFAVYTAGVDLGVSGNYFIDSIFFAYWSILLTPFASVASLPNLRARCKNLICFWRGRDVVVPQLFQMARLNIRGRSWHNYSSQNLSPTRLYCVFLHLYRLIFLNRQCIIKNVQNHAFQGQKRKRKKINVLSYFYRFANK